MTKNKLRNGQTFAFDPTNMQHTAFNPLAASDSDAITALLRCMCVEGLDAADQCELDDQLEAIVPALVELRDAGHLKLNFAVVASYGALEGFMRLADDERLSALSRGRCVAMRNRLVTQSVKVLLGHLSERS